MMNNNKDIPVVSMRTISAYKTDKELIDNLPAHVVCDNIQTFSALCEKYAKAGLRFEANENNYEVKS